MVKISSKSRLVKSIFGCFFAIMVGLASLFGTTSVYADPVTAPETTTTTPTTPETTTTTPTTPATTPAPTPGLSCEKSLGALGWLVCPTTGKISEAVDWLYEKIEGLLAINPVAVKDGTPIYEIWKYFRAISNIVFIIFLIIVIYSQLTGLGINNYGIKKSLPKLIVAAVLVNLSFVICSVAVDVSNIIGNGLRGLFESIEASTMGNIETGAVATQPHVAMAEMYSAMSGGAALAIAGGLVAFETGAIWMLIPTVLGAIVSVATGLITIALRQAVVALLIMIAPLAVVSNILPNTEQWFKKWKALLTRMLVFYPVFSLLFGASSLAGWAIIVSSSDGFGVLLGVAVQIFPLFFSWKLMKMSGTFLGSINSSLSKLAASPLAANRAWANSRRELTKQKYLASDKAYTPTLRLRQFLYNRKVDRDAETSQHAETAKQRALRYSAQRNYKRGDVDGLLNSRGLRAYNEQAETMLNRQIATRHTNNMNEGFAERFKGTAAYARLEALDIKNMNASDKLKAELARGEMIEFRNAEGFHNRMKSAVDSFEVYKRDPLTNELLRDANGKPIVDETRYRKHFDNQQTYQESLSRFDMVSNVMHGDLHNIHYAAAYATQAYDSQLKIITSKFQKYFETIPPTADVLQRIRDISFDPNSNANKNIDAIIAGMRVLNMRGDTNLVKDVMDDVLKEGTSLGTHSSQALASFLMFELKDKDPFLRRFGKYLNLETAQVFSNNRQNDKVTYEEYIKGEYQETDGTTKHSKKSMVDLLEGTSLDDIERTAMDNLVNSVKKAYGEKSGGVSELDVDAYHEKMNAINDAIGPQFISSSLKYPSGSEQVKSMAKYATGYSSKMKENAETGKMEEVWEKEWEAQAEDENGKKMFDADGNPIYKYDEETRAKMQKYYQDNTEKRYKGMTAGQVLKEKSNFKKPITEHLVNSWLDDSAHPEHRAEYDAEVRRISAKYSGRTDAEARKAQSAEIEKLKLRTAGKRLTTILDDSGKMKQILRMAVKSPGTLGDTKDWLRDDMLGLNANEATLKKMIDDIDRKRNASASTSSSVDSEDAPATRIYSDSDRNLFSAEIEKLYDNCEQNETEFFSEAIDKVNDQLGDGNTVVRKFAKYNRDYPEASDLDLYTYLIGLLEDPDNYPDA